MYDEQAIADRARLRDLEVREVYQGEVAEDVADLTDDLFIRLPQLDDDGELAHRYGPCKGWDRRSDGSYPSEGDDVLVSISDNGTYWVLAWWPYAD